MKFVLRPINLEDLDALVEYANNPRIAKNMTDGFPYPYTREAGKKFIGHTMESSPPKILAIDIEGKFSGAVGLHAQSDVLAKNFELGYWLAEPFWGNGIVTEAVKEMIDYGFKHWNVNRIYARPYGPNLGSRKVLEKAGFEKQGAFRDAVFKNGVYLDLMEYAVYRK